MGMLDFLGTGIIETVGKVADDLITSDEEKAEKENERLKNELNYKAEMRKADVEETKAYIDDRKSARSMNSDLKASKDWLVRNTGSLMAWIVVCSTFALDSYVILYGMGNVEIINKDMLMFILGAMNSYIVSIMSFYFGSSKTEADAKRVI